MTRLAVRVRLGAWVALVGLWLAPWAMAQDVTLTPYGDNPPIEGELLGFDGDFYRVLSQYGEVTVDATAVACDGPGCPSLTGFVADVAISGSATMGEVLMPALLQSYARREGLRLRREETGPQRFDIHLSDPARGRDVAVFRFHVTNTDEGFADLLIQSADIVMALRPIRPHEAEALAEVGLGDLTGPNRARVLALDALVPMVAPQNPVMHLGLADLAGILSGQITNWSELGGDDLPIAVHLRNAGSGLAQGVVDRILTPQGAPLRDDIQRHDSDAALDEAVSADPAAIGFGSQARLRNARVPDLRGPCGFVQSATRTAIKSEDYPLATPLLMYIPARRLPAVARDFLAYTRSPGAQIVIRRAGFVDQTPEELPLALQGDRLSNAVAVTTSRSGLDRLRKMRDAMAPRQRLTTAFRFGEDGALLDQASLSNVQQLARSLERGDFTGRSLLIAGFSDGSGADATNRRLSEERARTVQEVLQSAVIEPVPLLDDATIAGYGAQMPLACDDTALGRHSNARVEIWLE